MVGQHDAARAHPDMAGAASHMPDEDRGGRAGNARHAVVLGQPVALVAPLFGVLGQAQGVAKGLRGIAALQDGGEIENR